MEKLNPIRIVFIVLAIWIVLITLTNHRVIDFCMLRLIFSLPVVLTIVFIVSSLFYRDWVKENKLLIAVVSVLLLTWLFYFFYVPLFG